MERVWTLSIAPLAGGSPENSSRTCRLRYRLEYPLGTVLYETDGKIADPRVSPDGQLVAFIDQPRSGNDAGFVAVVDQAGKRRKISRDWRSTQGLGH
jgi:hypothetical protein